MSWRDLRNAPLIEAFARFSATASTVLPVGEIVGDSLMRGGVATKLMDDDLLPDYEHAVREFGVNGWRIGTICALMVYEDMHEILSCDFEHLGRMRKMFPNTELDVRCEAAQRFHTMVPTRVAKAACEEAKARPRRFA